MANIEKHGTGYIYGLAVRLLPMLLPVLLLASCNGRGEHVALLDRADSLLSAGSYDEARRLTDSIGTGHLSRSEEMRRLLLLADIANQCYEPLPSDSIMQQVTDYYDANGTPNEQMRAYYLRAALYRDMNNPTKSLQILNAASALADTADTDCDIVLLSKICSQKASVCEDQLMADEALRHCDEASYYSLKGNDSIRAVDCYFMKSHIYLLQNKTDEAKAVCDSSISFYLRHNLTETAGGCAGVMIDAMAERNMIPQLQYYTSLYRYKSGYFNESDPSDRGAHYFRLGNYFLSVNEPDSAILAFRRSYHDDSSSSSLYERQAACAGLEKAFKRLNQKDSVIKYADMKYQLSDTSYSRLVTEDMQRLSAAYRYDTYKDMAHKREIQAKKYQIYLMLALFIIIGGTLFYTWKRKRQHHRLLLLENQYLNALKDYRHANEAYEKIKHSEDSMKEEKAELMSEIRILQERISKYKEQLAPNIANRQKTDVMLANGDIVVKFRSIARHAKTMPTCREWSELREWIEMLLPSFYSALHPDGTNIRQEEYDLSILIRLSFRPSEIANLMQTTVSNVSANRRRLYTKLKKEQGSAKDFDDLVKGIY